MTASFPTTVPTTAGLRGDLVDNCSTLLSAAITDSATTIPVDDASRFPSAGLASLKKGSGAIEVVSYTGKTATTLTGVTRNFNGNGALAFSEDDTVALYWAADHHNRHVEETIAIAQNISDRFGLDAANVTKSLVIVTALDTSLTLETTLTGKAAFLKLTNSAGTTHEIGIESDTDGGGGRYAGGAGSLNIHLAASTLCYITSNGTGGTLVIDNTNARGGGIVVRNAGADVGFIGSSGVWLGISASNLAVGIQTGKTLSIYHNGGVSAALTVSTAGAFTFSAGNVNVFRSDAGTVSATAVNSNTSAGHAQFYAEVGGPSSGDPSIQFAIPSGATWTLGADNSASDAFVISKAGSLGSSNVFTSDGVSWALMHSGSVTMEYDNANNFIDVRKDFVPVDDNTYTCGASGRRWSAVWAATGSIQTSHSSLKRDIADIAEVRVPRGVTFRWKDREGRPDDRIVMGFLADDLPSDAFELKPDGSIDVTGVHTNAVLGELCAGWHNHEARIAALEHELAALRAA